MKAKNSLLLVAFLLISTTFFAQGPGSNFHKNSEKIKAMKVEYITTKLDLTPAEAEKFWPVYNEFIDKMQTLAKARRKKMQANKDKDLSDDEINNLIEFNFSTDQKMLDLKREYDKKYKSVLPVQKVGKLYQAEMEFKHELLRKMKGGPGGPGKGNGGGPGGGPR